MPDIHHHRHHLTAPKPSPKLLSIFLKFIVMSLILSLFLLFIGLAAIILIHLLFAGSLLHRRRRLSRPITPPSLPSFQYPAATTSEDCSICLELLNEGEICRVLPVCDHVFHARCVDRWLMKVSNCPVCRTRVRLHDDEVSDSVDGDDDNKFLWAIGVGR